MRNRRDVANRCNSKTNGLQRAQCRLSTRSGAFHFDFKGTDAMFGSLASRVLRAYLRGIGGRLTRTLKPIMPAEDQLIALPWASVMVTIVLLKLAFTCATPAEIFLRSRLRMRWGSRAIILKSYL